MLKKTAGPLFHESDFGRKLPGRVPAFEVRDTRNECDNRGVVDTGQGARKNRDLQSVSDVTIWIRRIQKMVWQRLYSAHFRQPQVGLPTDRVSASGTN